MNTYSAEKALRIIEIHYRESIEREKKITKRDRCSACYKHAITQRRNKYYLANKLENIFRHIYEY